MATNIDDLFCSRCWHNKTITIDRREFPGHCTCLLNTTTMAEVRARHRLSVKVAKGQARYVEPPPRPGQTPMSRLGGPPRSIKH